jgi:integral membrane protein
MTAATGTSAIPQELKGALLRYRVLAWITGVALLSLCAAMVAKYGFDKGAEVVTVVAQIHGFLFIVYLITVAHLGLIKMRWPLPRLLLVALAGTIPVMSFIFERKVTTELEAVAAAGDLKLAP